MKRSRLRAPLSISIPKNESMMIGQMATPGSGSGLASADSGPRTAPADLKYPRDNAFRGHLRSGSASSYKDGPINILPGVDLSGEAEPATLENYDVVINVAKEVACPLPVATPPANASKFPPIDHQHITRRAHRAGLRVVEYLTVPWEHSSQLVCDLDPLTSFMAARARDGQRVLVHCQCGVSRSASLVVAYVMRALGLDLQAAYNFVKARQPDISPNLGQMMQLNEWQEQGQSPQPELRPSHMSQAEAEAPAHAAPEAHAAATKQAHVPKQAAPKQAAPNQAGPNQAGQAPAPSS